MSESRVILAIDIGGTGIKSAVLADGQDQLQAIEYTSTVPDWDNAAFLDALEEIIWRYIPRFIVTRIAIGSPGPLDIPQGRLLASANLPGLQDVDLVFELEARLAEKGLNIEFYFNNDANCAALGEAAFGLGRNLDNFAVITLGTGVGGGLILNKRLFEGLAGNAMEIGHIPVIDPLLQALLGRGPSRLCGCGAHNCLETYASATGVSRSYQEFTGENLPAIDICERARSGDAQALRALEVAAAALAAGMISIIHLLNITEFIFTGGLAGAADLLEPLIRNSLAERPLVVFRDRIRMQWAPAGDHAGLYGAAALARTPAGWRV